MNVDIDSDAVDSDDEVDNESDDEDERYQCECVIKEAWKSLSPPVPEDDIIGKWYAVLWADKRSCQLYIAKVLRRFLEDKRGPISNIQMRCLKLKVGSGTILEDTAAHCPDIQMFPLCDIIAGPLDVIPRKGRLFDVTKYEWIMKEHFPNVINIDRSALAMYI